MCKVKIIFGAYGHKDGSRLVTKTIHSEPFFLDNAEAERLVSLGVAQIVAEDVATVVNESKVAQSSENPLCENVCTESEFEGDTGTAEYNVSMSVTALRSAAKERGISFKVGMSKEEMVDVLNRSDEEPILSAAEPV